jgi:hypothetical protein
MARTLRRSAQKDKNPTQSDTPPFKNDSRLSVRRPPFTMDATLSGNACCILKAKANPSHDIAS